MAEIFETKTFIVESQDKPFISREDGGHVKIVTKDKTIPDRTKMSPQQAIEYMRLSIIVGESLEQVMNEQGIPVVKINYLDAGNWAFKYNRPPHLHMHIFGRSKDAKVQRFPDAPQLPFTQTGFYDDFEPLTEEDIVLLRKRIQQFFQLKKFADNNWF